MVALDFYASKTFLRDRFRYWRRAWGCMAGAACLAMVLGLGWLLARDGGSKSLEAAAEYGWRLSALPFLAVMIVPPLAQLFPAWTQGRAIRVHAAVAMGFLALLAASLYFSLLASRMTGTDLDADTQSFCLYTGFMAALLALGIAPFTPRLLGAAAPSLLQRASTGGFWLIFVLDDLRHIYGPHRPDDYYGFSLLLFVGAILVRFAGAFRQRIRPGGLGTLGQE